MNQELAIAKGELRDLELQAQTAEMAVEEERRHLREITGPIIDTRGLDPVRIAFLSARLISAISGLRKIDARIQTLRQEYGL